MVTETTRLSSTGQVIIPKTICETYRWAISQEFIVKDTGSILLLPKSPFPPTTVSGAVQTGRVRGPSAMQ